VITSFNLNPYTLMMDRRNKIMKHDTHSNDISFIFFFCVFHVTIDHFIKVNF
jgi:hypothetical protein